MIEADEKSGLKLISKNQEDIKVISAYLQDSIVKVKRENKKGNFDMFKHICLRFTCSEGYGE